MLTGELRNGLPRIRVGALVVQDHKVLLVRHRKAGREYWMLPGGGVETGEGLHEALARELLEETGLSIVPGELLLAVDTIAPEHTRHIVHLTFAAEVVGGKLIGSIDPRVVDVAFLPLDEFKETAFLPDIKEELYSLATCSGKRGVEYLGKRWLTLD